MTANLRPEDFGASSEPASTRAVDGSVEPRTRAREGATTKTASDRVDASDAELSTRVAGEFDEIAVVRDVSEAGVTIREKRGILANMNEMGQNQVGLIMFGVVTALVLCMLLFVAAYAWLTYPSTSDVEALLGKAAADDPLGAVSQAREQWSNSVEHVAQLFIFGSLVPLLAAIVGYVLGERTAKSSGS